MAEKGVEFHDQHVGKVWRFEEGGGRKGGSGTDSSVESRGTEEVCRIRHGGIDRMVDSRNRSEGCRVDFWEEGRVGIRGLKSCSMSSKLHMNILLRRCHTAKLKQRRERVIQEVEVRRSKAKAKHCRSTANKGRNAKATYTS